MDTPRPVAPVPPTTPDSTPDSSPETPETTQTRLAPQPGRPRGRQGPRLTEADRALLASAPALPPYVPPTAVPEDAETSEVPRRKRGPRPGSPGAQAGGRAVKAKYGQDFFRRIGQKGGQTVKATRGSAFYAAIGQKGGTQTKERHGQEYYQTIGAVGGSRGRGRARLHRNTSEDDGKPQPE